MSREQMLIAREVALCAREAAVHDFEQHLEAGADRNRSAANTMLEVWKC